MNTMWKQATGRDVMVVAEKMIDAEKEFSDLLLLGGPGILCDVWNLFRQLYVF